MATKIHLEHPNHGRKIAYLQAEADADKKNGWKEVGPPTLPAPAEAKVAAEAKGEPEPAANALGATPAARPSRGKRG